MYRYTIGNFSPGIPGGGFAAGDPGFDPENPQMELVAECHRAAQLLLRLHMQRGRNANFAQAPVQGQEDPIDVPEPPFMPIPGGPGSIFLRRNVGAMRGQGRLLFMLSQHDGVFIKDIVEAFDIRPSSASELVAKLEKQGLVRVESDDEDKRARKVFLTDEGKVLADQMKPEHDDLFDGLSEEEQTQLLGLLKKMNTSLTEKSQDLDKQNPRRASRQVQARQPRMHTRRRS
ncbi:MAG: MarR family transcriptional regulator [Coriobacteriia bacterium]|nr:MarR family transcriptional regulator [Coriobacteriia bacterium]